MKIFIIDSDHDLILRLSSLLKERFSDAELIPFSTAEEFTGYKFKSGTDIAFIEISPREIKGTDLALLLKEHSPRCNFIFMSAFPETAADCFRARPSGFMLKPFDDDAVYAELDDLRFPAEIDSLFKKRLRVITFGSFTVYNDRNELIRFTRSAAREIFAYLIDMNGYPVTSRDIAADVFEKSEFDTQTSKNISKYTGYLLRDLEAAGFPDAVIRQNRTLRINKNRIDCDIYNALQGDFGALNSYKGEYMIDFSWAETSEAAKRLRQRLKL